MTHTERAAALLPYDGAPLDRATLVAEFQRVEAAAYERAAQKAIASGLAGRFGIAEDIRAPAKGGLGDHP